MRVQYLKHPDTPHWSHDPMVVLGEDEHGIWLGASAMTWLQKGEIPTPRNLHERGFHCRNPFVQLVVPDGWWTLIFNGEDRDITHYVDIVTPALREDGVVTFVDLDLDVIRDQDGGVRLDDEDEFIKHQDRLRYPPAWVDQARTTAARLVVALERLDEPFDRACRTWRDRLLTP